MGSIWESLSPCCGVCNVAMRFYRRVPSSSSFQHGVFEGLAMLQRRALRRQSADRATRDRKQPVVAGREKRRDERKVEMIKEGEWRK